VVNHGANLLGRDHPIRARHLPQGVRQIKPPPGGGRSDALHDIRLTAHPPVLLAAYISSRVSLVVYLYGTFNSAQYAERRR
jgi:hypothetical protein